MTEMLLFWLRTGVRPINIQISLQRLIQVLYRYKAITRLLLAFKPCTTLTTTHWIMMSRFPKPCLACNKLTTGASYCEQHQAIVDEKEKVRQNNRKRGRTLYDSSHYRKARAYLKATATHCHLCNQPFTNRNDITADHVIAGDPLSPLAPAHSICNSRRGNKPLT